MSEEKLRLRNVKTQPHLVPPSLEVSEIVFMLHLLFITPIKSKNQNDEYDGKFKKNDTIAPQQIFVPMKNENNYPTQRKLLISVLFVTLLALATRLYHIAEGNFVV